MADFDGHLKGSTFVSIVVGITTLNLTASTASAIIAGVISFVSGLYPDMDIASKARRYITLVAIPIILYFYYQHQYDYSLIVSMLVLIPSIFKHRGFVHSFVFMGLLTTATYYYFGIISVAVIPGYLIHLILDEHFKMF